MTERETGKEIVKNGITLGPGRLFFNTPEGLQPLGSIYEGAILEEAEETAEPWTKENPYIKPTDDATFTAEARIGPDVAKAFKTVGDMATKLTETFSVLWSLVKRVFELYERYPNKRVKHLALYAKKRRTRKKNMRRIARELKKEAQT